jgi:hypothetical protein
MHRPIHQQMLKFVSENYMHRRLDDSTPTDADMAALDSVLRQIKQDNPHIFLTKDDLSQRVFFHRPDSKIAYAGYITHERIKRDEDETCR